MCGNLLEKQKVVITITTKQPGQMIAAPAVLFFKIR
jgi:hypothetical protein